MKIEYTNHLKFRIKIRNIPKEYPKVIYENPEQVFIDILEKRKVAIKKLKYNNKLRNIMIAYDEFNDKIEIVTIHPISDEQLINRLISGRYIEDEKI